MLRFLVCLNLISHPIILFGASLQEEILKNEAAVSKILGEKRFRKVVEKAKSGGIDRISQLLSIEGVGVKTMIKLSAILGVRFSHHINIDTCVKERIC